MTLEVTPETTADVLEEAADILETLGWCQGASRLPTGERCLTGAIDEAIQRFHRGRISHAVPAVYAICRRMGYLRSSGEARAEKLIMWNDANDRTQAEVVDELKLTAKDVRNGDLPVPVLLVDPMVWAFPLQ